MYIVHHNSNTIALATILILAAIGSTFGDEYCKWTDENGVVHYDENCPDDVTSAVVATEGKRTENQIKAAEEYAKSLQSEPTESTKSTGKSKRTASGNDAGANAQLRPQDSKDFSQMSVEQLEVLCQKEREKRLAPEREQLIQDCINIKRKSPDYCKRYYSDYGAPVRLDTGYMRPALYSDLPECVAAWEARRKKN